MRNTILLLTLLAPQLAAVAQDATYHLPRTAVAVNVLVEKTAYTPGTLSAYSQRFLKKNVAQEAYTSYRIVSTTMRPTAVPDTARVYTAHIDQKHNISRLALSEDNILLAINAEPKPQTVHKPFAAAARPAALDPYQYLSQDIVSVGSKLKMAQLTAQEIYDIRDSRNELTRGQADYMPKDGEQLRLMLANLATQEAAMRQMFEGVTRRDTTERTFIFVPTPGEESSMLFRFSKHFGFVDADDLSGEAYTMSVADLHSMPERIGEPGRKTAKDETGVWIALPGKIHLSLASPAGECAALDVSAAQYGEVENMGEPLFSKKVETRLVLNPYNGGIESIDSTPVK